MFGWFKKSLSQTNSEGERNILHGHDLEKWHYLGYVTCFYTDSSGAICRENPIFLFVSKCDENKRSYKITGSRWEDTFRDHSYIHKALMPWAAGEKEIYSLIVGKLSSPSDYLRQYMLEKFGCEWDNDINWWKSSSNSKHKQAMIKQKSSDKRVTEDDNVIQVDFSGD